MAEVRRAPSVPSLGGLEEELTCSICLCVFESPVTTPCGHNFCLPCLEMTWGGGVAGPFSCPQCRSAFARRPELKKNTVLCRVVEQLHGAPRAAGAPAPPGPPEKERPGGVACDSCLGAEAAQTCLTCMASFCAEHLRPHLDSPAFQGHARCPPVRDLQRRRCPEHGKLLDFYCTEHAACICCICLVTHKACAALPLPEAKAAKESQLKKRLTELYALNEKSSQSLDQLQVQQKDISEIAARKLDLLRAEFKEILTLITEEEKNAISKVGAEEKRVREKFAYVNKILCKKRNEIQGERDQIEMILTEDEDITFLAKADKLQQSSIKDVFIPRIDLDQNLIHTVYQNAFGLKEALKQFVAQPLEKKTEGSTPRKPKPLIPQPGRNPPPQPAQKNTDSSKDTSKSAQNSNAEDASEPKNKRRPANRTSSPTQRARSSSRPQPGAPSATLESFLTKSREELLEFAAKFSLDYHTAHNKVILSDRCSKMSVSDTPQNFPPHPHRFTYCSQVQSFQCFKRGIHYWEVELERNNFCGIGICYGSMAREGAESRLGRNSSSWCIEWFNARMSAWHNDIEKCLPNTKVKKIGVLLNYEGGFVIFFGVGEKICVLYKFRAQFIEALYAAFWVFSSGTTISLCQLK